MPKERQTERCWRRRRHDFEYCRLRASGLSSSWQVSFPRQGFNKVGTLDSVYSVCLQLLTFHRRVQELFARASDCCHIPQILIQWNVILGRISYCHVLFRINIGNKSLLVRVIGYFCCRTEFNQYRESSTPPQYLFSEDDPLITKLCGIWDLIELEINTIPNSLPNWMD